MGMKAGLWMSVSGMRRMGRRTGQGNSTSHCPRVSCCKLSPGFPSVLDGKHGSDADVPLRVSGRVDTLRKPSMLLCCVPHPPYPLHLPL